MLFHWILVCWISVTPFSLKAQDPELSLRMGPGVYARQDLIFSPFVHQDWSFTNVALQYDWGQKHHQFTALEYGGYNPSLVPSYTYGTEGDQTYPHQFTLVNLTYGFGKRIQQQNENHRLTLGGAFEADIQASNYYYGPFSNFGYLAPFSLGIWGQWTLLHGEKNEWTGKVLIPLVSLVARSPYLVNDDEYIENTYSHNGFTTFFEYLGDGHLQTLNKIQQLEVQLGFKHHLSEKWAIGGIYAFRFQHVAETLNFLSFRNTFYINLSRTF